MARFWDLPPEANEHFPVHGSIISPTGIRLLRLPVMRLYQHGQPTDRHFMKNKISGVWRQYRSPNRTLRQLAVCLRDLHREIREITPLTGLLHENGTDNNKRDRDLTRHKEGLERSEVFLIAAFVLLRRLADELIDTSRPFLFEHWKSAPRMMKVAVSSARDDKLKLLNPICDVDVLTKALLEHTSWLDRLRDVGGIRDILAHRPHYLQLGAHGLRNPDETSINWRITALLSQWNRGKGFRHIDLFPALIECIDDVCIFMEHLCISVGLDNGYQQGDYLMLSGQDNDIVGFWPPIQGTRTEFPLMD